MAKINLQVLNQRTKGPIRPPTAIRRRQARRRRLGLLALILLFLLVLAALILTFAPFLKIKQVAVTGTQVVDPRSAGELASQILNRRAFFIFPRNHLAWYPAGEITAALQREFPRLLAVKMSAGLDHRLEIAVEERTPLLLLCSPLAEASKCHFVDQTGLAYTRAPLFSPGVFLKWQATTTATSSPFRVAEAPAVRRLLDTKRLFELALEEVWPRRFRINEVESLPAGDYAFIISPRYRLATSSSWRALIDHERPAPELADNLLTALEAVAAGTTTADTLEYVDLRFGEKVFYKL